MKNIITRKPKPTPIEQRIASVQADTLSAIHQHALATDIALSAAESLSTARANLRDLARDQYIAAAVAESNALCLEEVAGQLALYDRDVDATFAPLTYIS